MWTLSYKLTNKYLDYQFFGLTSCIMIYFIYSFLFESNLIIIHKLVFWNDPSRLYGFCWILKVEYIFILKFVEIR